MTANVSYCNFLQSQIELFRQKIDLAKNIIILPHADADGDALGSAQGLKKALEKLGKIVEIVCPDQPKVNVENASFLVGTYTRFPDLLISVDCGAKYRAFLPKDFENVFLVNIDHHVSNDYFGDLNFVEPLAASACEVVVVLLLNLYGREIFDPSIAAPLMFGILTDTLCFRTEATNKDTFQIASFLLSFNINFSKLKETAAQRTTFSEFLLWSKLLEQSELILNKYLVLKIDQSFLQKNNALAKSFEGLVNFLCQQISCDLIALLIEKEPGVVKGSLRSKKVDVHQIAKLFNGGGHIRAAGFLVKDSNLEQVYKNFIAQLKML